MHSFFGRNWTGEPPPTDGCGRWDRGWLAVVEEYVRRKLIFGKDKLPALAGLARLVANATGDEYYAGLWRDHILEDLYWGVAVSDSSPVKLPVAYRAPSWSWASLDAAVKFIPLDPVYVIVNLVQCVTVSTGIDRYGELKNGWMKLSARITAILP